MSAYYNEFDPGAAAWLRELIKRGLIADGDVDERSILDVAADDIKGFTQCHFFAGIGGWAHALNLAGWPTDRPVWTGSCPCQPFSAAGRRAGTADERHLWPHWFHLIGECKPGVVFGEQVASKDGLGWLDLVSADMEGAGYAFAANDLCAAGIGAPHIRQRLWFVGLADAECWAAERHGHEMGSAAQGVQGSSWQQRLWPDAGDGVNTDGLADASADGSQGRVSGRQDAGREAVHGSAGCGGADRGPRPTDGFWRDADWLFCRDGKWRPVEPGTFPLAHGLPARVGRLRGYGNAIVPQVAQAFISAVMECAA